MNIQQQLTQTTSTCAFHRNRPTLSEQILSRTTCHEFYLLARPTSSSSHATLSDNTYTVLIQHNSAVLLILQSVHGEVVDGKIARGSHSHYRQLTQ